MTPALCLILLRGTLLDHQDTRLIRWLQRGYEAILSRIAAFVEDASARVLERVPDARRVIYGHMGDGNVHFNPLRPKDQPAKEFLAQWYEPVSTLVDAMAHAENGSISAEHGIGVVKRDDLTRYKSRVELELMWQVKQALDPLNLLNPGKVLPPLGQ